MYLLNVVEKCICIKQITQSTAVFSTFVTLLPRASHAEHELTRPHSCKNSEQCIIFSCLLNTNKLQGATNMDWAVKYSKANQTVSMDPVPFCIISYFDLVRFSPF